MSSTNLHYAIRPIEIDVAQIIRQKMPLAVLSGFGIYRAFPETDELYEAFIMAEPVTIKIEDDFYRGRLVRIHGFLDSHFAVKWVFRNEEEKKQILSLVRREGNRSPRRRRYERHSVANARPGLEIPVKAKINSLVGIKQAKVINFSFCGLSAEYFCTGSSLAEYPGQTVQMSLSTSKNKLIEPISARIIRVYDEMIAPAHMIRGVGLKFVRFSHVGRRHYLRLITLASKRA